MTDLPPNTVPGQGYGEQAEQRRQMQALPMGAQPGLEPPPSLTAPTARPNEPVQAGLPIGPGPGPEALGAMDSTQLTRQTLQAMLRRFPSPALRKMLMDMER